ncbi:hypothetical protein ABZ897_37410 [Nonomuraea sp. NPDC046802]|uniref:hypothetical protein n=1 Tax=Nonomuraea sp. NPDC046802 TaxID=3154919 RepID=UPI0033E837FD
MVVLVLIVLAVVVGSVLFLAVLVLMAGTMTDWRARLRRLLRRKARLELKRSGDTVPDRMRAELSGTTPSLRRRFHLGGTHPRGPRRVSGDPRPRLRHHEKREQHTKI